MIEFTGERVIPGQVDPDLWNEHYSRYLFAARLARFRRVLDLGCGSGYGSALLAQTARLVYALDASSDALQLAGEALHGRTNVAPVQASAAQLPFAPNSLDLVVAFEVIEHLNDWPDLIQEARRVLAPGGQFIVSTPNRDFYNAERGQSGPNPFHAHEFSFDEFRDALRQVFPHVSMFVQNHAAGVVFRPIEENATSDVKLEAGALDPTQCHFFVAVCAASPQTGSPNFVYVPSSANVLKEREKHIHLLADEVTAKNEWLEKQQAEHAALVEQHRLQKAKLEESNRWAEAAALEAKQTQARNAALQEELQQEQARGAQVVTAYEKRIHDLEHEMKQTVLWAQDTETRLTAEVARVNDAFEERSREFVEKAKELAECVRLLDAAEQTVVQRTEWAQSLQTRVLDLETQLSAVQSSRWVKLGKSIGLGPKVATAE
jgi:SAM-dependent methyltransferase